MIYPSNGQPIVGVVSDLLRAHRWETLGLRVERGRLDDVFRQITLSH
jgi:ABC-2 type transport system ATP-binding protein